MMSCAVGCGKKDQQTIINVSSADNLEASAYLSYNNKEVLINVVNNSGEEKNVVANVNLNYKDNVNEEEVKGYYLKPKENTVLLLDIDGEEEPLKSIDITVDYLDEKYDFFKKGIRDNLITSYEVFDDLTVDVTLKSTNQLDIDEVSANVVFYNQDIPIYAEKIYLLDFNESVTDTIDIPLENENSDKVISGDYIKIYIDDVIVDYEIDDVEEEIVESSD